MSVIKVTVEHPDAHEPNADTFEKDFSAGVTKVLHADGLKRGGDFESKIVGYQQTSGVATVYDVEVSGTEESAAAKKDDAPAAKTAEKK